MSAKMTSSKRFIVRTALVTSTTLATIMGAQALASFDGAASFEPTVIPTEFATHSTMMPQISDANVSAAAPNIVILRRGGEQPTTNTNILPPAANQGDGQQILPPNAVQVAPPPPIVQQVPRTRSSR